jgi:hypothetical protein
VADRNIRIGVGDMPECHWHEILSFNGIHRGQYRRFGYIRRANLLLHHLVPLDFHVHFPVRL